MLGLIFKSFQCKHHICLFFSDFFLFFLTADGNGDLAAALGMVKDCRAAFMGLRTYRYSMFIDNGVVKHLFIDEKGTLIGGCEFESVAMYCSFTLLMLLFLKTLRLWKYKR